MMHCLGMWIIERGLVVTVVYDSTLVVMIMVESSSPSLVDEVIGELAEVFESGCSRTDVVHHLNYSC